MTSSRYQPGMRISEYTLERQIGAGSFGEVWSARHHVWKDDRVAIKLPTEREYVRYLQREGIVVHGLRHPNIVRVLGMDPFAEHPYLVMELVDGPSVRDVLIDNPKGIPIDVAVVILRGILRAMSAAHGNNVLHRDLKPGNVLLNLTGHPLAFVGVDDVKVGDFGLGVANPEMLRSIAQSASMARDDQLVGTLAYMAPEVRDGSRKPDSRSDLYAIGVILFELITGERPAGAEFPSAVRADSPQELDAVFARLYARYDRRYESADAVLAELDQRLGGREHVGSRAPPPLPSRAASTRQPRRCDACGYLGESDDQFCVRCGRTLVSEVRRCGACNAFPGPDDLYCIFCGAALPSVRTG